MSDVDQATCPHHEVTFTFMRAKSQVVFLCPYGLQRRNSFCSSSTTLCALYLPNQEEWNAWKRYDCTLTWSTVNGWVKVPFEKYDKKIKNKRHKKLSHTLCSTVWINCVTIKLISDTFEVCWNTFLTSVKRFTVNLLFISRKHGINIFCAMSINNKSLVLQKYSTLWYMDTK